MSQLVFSRKENEKVVIGQELVVIQVEDIRDKRVHLRITAGEELRIDRSEIYTEIRERVSKDAASLLDYPADEQMLAGIQGDVRAWSSGNFGEQASKSQPGLVLGSLAPSEGLTEEIGELCAAKDTAEFKDALGDILIYLCDFCWRWWDGDSIAHYVGFFDVGASEGVALCLAEQPDPLVLARLHLQVVSARGSLAHATLKHHQGIRKFASEPYYRQMAQEAIGKLITAVSRLCVYALRRRAEAVLLEVWTKIVSKRNWKVNQAEGKVGRAIVRIPSHTPSEAEAYQKGQEAWWRFVDVGVSAAIVNPYPPHSYLAIAFDAGVALQRQADESVSKTLGEIVHAESCPNDTNGDGDCHKCAPGPCREAPPSSWAEQVMDETGQSPIYSNPSEAPLAEEEFTVDLES